MNNSPSQRRNSLERAISFVYKSPHADREEKNPEPSKIDPKNYWGMAQYVPTKLGTVQSLRALTDSPNARKSRSTARTSRTSTRQQQRQPETAETTSIKDTHQSKLEERVVLLEGQTSALEARIALLEQSELNKWV